MNDEQETLSADPLNWSFQELANFLPDPIIVLDSTLGIIYWNPAAERLFGYSSNDVTCQSMDLLIPDQSLFAGFALPDSPALQDLLVSQKTMVLSGYGKHRDGHTIPLEIAVTVKKWHHETFMVCNLRDISHQIAYQNAINALNESEQRYRGILDSQNTLVLRADRDGQIVYANQAYSLMFGILLEDLIGLPLLPLLNSSDFSSMDDVMNALKNPSARFNIEQRANTLNGDRWINWDYGLIQDPVRNLYEIQAVGYDVTDRKQGEEIATIERDLAIILAQKSSIQEGLPLVLDMALRVADMDCGGIYMVDRKTKDLVLMYHTGLSEAFVARSNHFASDAPNHQLVMRGAPLYMPYLQLPTTKPGAALNEGLHFSGIIPIKFKQQVIACLNVASHWVDDILPFRRAALENLAFQLGHMIDRLQAQDDLAESQHELKSMFDSLQDFVFVLNLSGQIIQVNQKVMDSLGYSWEELEHLSVLEVHPRDEREEAWRIVNEMLAGRLDICPLNLLRKDGSQIPVETKIVHGSWGNESVIIGVSRDITERKAAEDARQQYTRLLEYRNQFEEILTTISTRFINLPTEETDTEVNHVLEVIGTFERVDFAYVYEFDREKGRLDLTHEWVAEGVQPKKDILRRLPTEHFPWAMKKLEALEEIYIPLVDAMPVEAQIERERFKRQGIQSMLIVPLVSHNVLMGMVGFVSLAQPRSWSTDSILLIKMVGDALLSALMRRTMEYKLRDSETRNSALLSAVPDMIYRVRRDGVLLDFKSHTNEMLFAAPDRLVGSALKDMLEESLASELMAHIEAALAGSTIQTLEYTAKIEDSLHVFEARFKDSGPDEVTMIVRDISDRARLEQMKSDFINRATHELRTPIATMLLMVNLIDGGASTEEQKEFWEILKGEISREQMLVENLLNVGRMENDQTPLHFGTVNVAGLVKKVIAQMDMPGRDKNIQFTLELEDGDGVGDEWIRGDEGALTQVFVNLLGNAIKFTPQNGRVTVCIQRKELGFEVSIRDTGIGIPSEDLALLFTRFFRGTNATENEIPGTGIGLFIVRSIVERHAGKVKVHSEIGKGSQFDVWLPTHPPESGDTDLNENVSAAFLGEDIEF